jgi:dihydrofolate reductase
MYKAVVAVDRNWAIGKGDKLLCHLPGDLKYFKELTIGKKILVGRKTLDSFPGGRPLPGRENIVVTRDPSFEREGCTVCHSLEEALSQAGEVIVCGGDSIYRAMLPMTDTVYVTKIDAAFDADRYFPNLDEDPEWEITADSDEMTYFDIAYQFVKYERRKD